MLPTQLLHNALEGTADVVVNMHIGIMAIAGGTFIFFISLFVFLLLFLHKKIKMLKQQNRQSCQICLNDVESPSLSWCDDNIEMQSPNYEDITEAESQL